jgi:hypothetical protein
MYNHVQENLIIHQLFLEGFNFLLKWLHWVQANFIAHLLSLSVPTEGKN